MNKQYLTWEDFFTDLDHKFAKYAPSVIYGVPKGGMLAAGFLANNYDKFDLTADPNEAEMIIDDIIDSGETKAKYKQAYPNTPFKAIYDAENWNGWLVFPWEADHPAGEESVQDNIIRILQYAGKDLSLTDRIKKLIDAWAKI